MGGAGRPGAMTATGGVCGAAAGVTIGGVTIGGVRGLSGRGEPGPTTGG